MSASKKKKIRQENTDLTEKQLDAAAKAAADKRKHTLYAVLAVIAAVAIAALLIWDSGLMQKNSTAMTIHGRDYTPGEVSYYYGTIREQYSPYLPYMGYDATISDRDQMWDTAAGQSYYDLFMGEAKALMLRTAALVDSARAAGVTLNDDSRQLVDTALEDYQTMASQYGYPYDAFLKANFGKYMTPEILEACLEDSALGNQYYAEYANSLEYTDAEIETSYKENAANLDTFVYDICFISGTPAAKTDADGKTVAATDEEKTAAMNAAKALAEELKNASNFAVQANLAAGKSEYSYFNQDIHASGSAISVLYQEWLADANRKEGDITVVESAGSGYHVVRFVDRYLDEKAFTFADIRHILVLADVEEGATTASAAAMDAAKLEAQAILDEFSVGTKTGEAFGVLAKEYSADPGSKDNGGMYADVTRNTSFFEGFLNWIFAEGRQVGDTGLVENPQIGQQGWHVMYLDNAEGTYWRDNAKTLLLSTDLEAWLLGLQDGYEAVEGSGIQHVG